MKPFITKKEMRNRFDKIISIPYCMAHNMLMYQEPYGYHGTDTNGWNCDYYIVCDVLICTGYNPIKGTLEARYDDIMLFDDRARSEITNHFPNYEESKDAVDNVLFDFIAFIQM